MGNLGDYHGSDEVLGDFSPIPNGDYTVAAIESEVLDTKDGTGKRASIKFEVMSGAHKGRWIWASINIVNKSPKCQQMGIKEMNTLSKACGLDPKSLQDTTQLHGIALSVTTAIKQDSGYKPSNEITAYKSVDGKAPVAPPVDSAEGQNEAMQETASDAAPAWSQ